jgi:hypothetical protein
VFEEMPPPHLLVDRELKIVDANDACLGTTMTMRGNIGCGIFDVFLDIPSQPNMGGTHNLGQSFARVLDHDRSDRMKTQRYDICRSDGTFEERWWEPLNIPAFDSDGKLALILHHFEYVTADRERSVAASFISGQTPRCPECCIGRISR